MSNKYGLPDESFEAARAVVEPIENQTLAPTREMADVLQHEVESILDNLPIRASLAALTQDPQMVLRMAASSPSNNAMRGLLSLISKISGMMLVMLEIARRGKEDREGKK